ncbi:MAG: amidohydrolase family protein [Firmicutes bacterium]|nr:amidohydrolase family protein [Bacillota bacterium]
MGQLSPGYSADFIVLSDDIFSIGADQIDRVHAAETWINGERVYSG